MTDAKGILDHVLGKRIITYVMKKAKFWEQHQQQQYNDRQLKIIKGLPDGMEGKLTSNGRRLNICRI